MTKFIRIENADTAAYKVKVRVQDKDFELIEGKLVYTGVWKDTKIIELNYPTAMLNEYLTTTRRFIIEENGVV
jgi:hypothetical protein